MRKVKMTKVASPTRTREEAKKEERAKRREFRDGARNVPELMV